MEKINWILNDSRKPGKKSSLDFLNEQEAKKAVNFHRTFEQYKPTPLRALNNLAADMGVSGVYVKDESYRFGLNAFKVLGGSYAMGKYIAEKMNEDISRLSYQKIKSDEVKNKIGNITFVTATDGNHGRGVAWTANQLGQKSVVYMPEGSAVRRLENIRAEGADASIMEGMNYDDAVRLAAENAKKYGWVVVQDTAWEGYTDIPVWIMQGYATMAFEALEQFNGMGVEKPTHIFVQAGVGSLAGAVQGFYAAVFNESRPVTVIVEPNKADCIFKSARAGEKRVVKGRMDTIMAGLACGEPNYIGWEILRDYSDAFVSCPDYTAAKGMRILGNPLGNDERVISGESGAVTTGLLDIIMRDGNLQEIKDSLGLNKDSKILVFSTEGDTDPEHYRQVVWDGKYPSI